MWLAAPAIIIPRPPPLVCPPRLRRPPLARTSGVPGITIPAGLYVAGSVGTQASYPVDGLSPTGCWSLSRFLRSAYTGSKYSATSGAITTINDQSGNGFNLTDRSLTTRRPAETTAGLQSRACAAFDGTSDFLVTGTTVLVSSLISASAGFIIISCIIDAFQGNQATLQFNDQLTGDQNLKIGLYLRDLSGGTAYAINDSGTIQNQSRTLTTAKGYVLTWRHEGGNLFFGSAERDPLWNTFTFVDPLPPWTWTGAYTETGGVASGNTAAFPAGDTFNIGGRGNQFFKGKIFELATFSTVPTAEQRAALVTDFGTWFGG
jgi:hypothetical protein